MIKSVIFDLDGVLVDSRDLHYHTLNTALATIGPQYVISREEHLSKFDGLPTTRKLDILTRERNLPRDQHDTIWQLKQKATLQYIDNNYVPDIQKVELFRELKNQGYKIAVASNSIRETIKLILIRCGLIEYVDYYFSNEDVRYSKPHWEIYTRAMLSLNTSPDQTLIVEDSHVGRQAALSSGAHLMPVESPSDVDLQSVMDSVQYFDQHSGEKYRKLPWRARNLTVLIPMAGAGSRFADAGYTFPKPLIDVRGKPMIQTAVRNINIEANYVFIVRQEHYEKYNLEHVLNLIKPGCKIVQVDHLTEGAACTTLLAKQYIDNDNGLFIANSDQFVEWNTNEVMYAFSQPEIDGGILCFDSSHPKWSFAKLDADGFVEQIAEKKPISNLATVGFYYWRRGSDYVKYAEQMIERKHKVNNEYYVAPVYNEAIASGLKFRVKMAERMWGIGTPEDLNYFLNNYQGDI